MADNKITEENSDNTKETEPERRFVEDRWLCWDEKTGIFLEYVDGEWKSTDSDQQSTLRTKWDNSANLSSSTFSGVQSAAGTSNSSDPYHCEHNGVKMAWNELSKQWLPEVEVNEDFLAQYNASYGVDYDYSNMPVPEPQLRKEEPHKLTKEEKRANKREWEKQQAIKNQGWVDIEDDKNTNVYVEGLPSEITDEEFGELMSKCGVIMKDPRTRKLKIKIYRNENGEAKGDATCCYVKMESVTMALEILDGWTFNGHKIHVEKAKYELKGEFDPSKKKKKLTADQKKKFFESQHKVFEWKPETERNHY